MTSKEEISKLMNGCMYNVMEVGLLKDGYTGDNG